MAIFGFVILCIIASILSAGTFVSGIAFLQFGFDYKELGGLTVIMLIVSCILWYIAYHFGPFVILMKG